MARDKKLIIANWKMNLNTHEASLYLHKLSKAIKVRRGVEIVLAPTTLALQSLSLQVNRRQFKLAAQNFYWRDHGPYTGEVSASQLHGVVDYAIVGHSERRYIFNETDKDIRYKVQAAVRNRIRPVLCIGETAMERSDGETTVILHDQLIGGLINLTGEEIAEIVIAYEPVWAIGTGKCALPADVVKAANTIRNQIKHLYGKEIAENIPVLYGGSVTPDSAADFLDLPEIDGLLIGDASLDIHAFSEIINKAHKASAAEEN